MTLRPTHSQSAALDARQESTGSALDFPSQFEEGNLPSTLTLPDNNPTDPEAEATADDLEETQENTRPVTCEEEEQAEKEINEIADQTYLPEKGPSARRQRWLDRRKKKETLMAKARQALIKAFSAEVVQAQELEGKEDPNNYFPPPHSIHQTIRFKDKRKKEAWLKATKKELAQLINSDTFNLKTEKRPENQ